MMPHDSEARVYTGTFVDCPSVGELRILRDHLLEVDNEGNISHFGPVPIHERNTPAADALAIENGSFFIPTFCDLHLHAPQYLYQGTGLHLPLMEWLDQYAFKAEERIDSDHALAERVYTKLASRLLENGTGSVLLFGTIKEETNLILARCMQLAGIRAFIGKLSMDQSSRATYVEASTQDALSSAKSFAERCRNMVSSLPVHERLIEPVLTPRFVPTCSDELLSCLGNLAESSSLRIQSHLAEARDQVDWVKKERGVDDIDVFDKNKLLTPRTVQAHCTFLQGDGLQTLRDRGTAVAHCPLSNTYFSSQMFCLREALDIGVSVGLGTDIAGGYSLDIMNAMRSAVVVSRIREGERVENRRGGSALSIDWKTALYLATRGGAVALNLPEGSGMFTVGAPFDAQLIRAFDSSGKDAVGPLDFFPEDLGSRVVTEEVIEKWWCLGDARNRKGVWVQGRQRV
ncbi:Metallo-dependent hydrolase [Rickenella mellea]|uniref:Metallo-dependent hydrolase n=1 Tax=Rickenella mellea TaxID=50990 RepID=A0A4R5XF28_9AGAM|nr:Metallo-dependent hydrolase [Rickenella mellea]